MFLSVESTGTDLDGYRARHAQPEGHIAVVDVANEAPADDWFAIDGDGLQDFRFAVRPYTWTRGRTQPLQDLAVETLVATSEEARGVIADCSTEHAAIVELCADVRSVAEVAALLTLPLGVARVLLADMIDTGLVRVHRNPHTLGSVPDISLLERVLGGLYRL